MSPDFHARVRDLFDEALERSEPERLAFLNEACSGEPDVFQAVVGLLEARRNSASFLEDDPHATRRIGRYLVMEELGRGAMGIVYDAIDPLIGRKVAIKVIHIESFAEAGKAKFLRERLFHEARSVGRLSHRGIVLVFDVGQKDDLAFIAMERVEGPSLYRVLSSRGRLPLAKALDILRQAADALDYAHRNGVVHRDIKPANIMLERGDVVKIGDFGIAKITSSEHPTLSGVVIGTPSYMSPEQLEQLPSTAMSDQFSLAVVAFEMLTGRKPFESDSLAGLTHMIVNGARPSAREVNPQLPAALDAVFRRGMARGAGDRYMSCTDFVTALEEASRQLEAPRLGQRPSGSASAPALAPLSSGAPSALDRRAPTPVRYYLAGGVVLALLLGLAASKMLPLAASVSPKVTPGGAKADLPIVGRFLADPQSIESGSPAMLHWDVSGATEVVLDPGIGRVSATGVIEVNPVKSLTYVLTATGPSGSVSKQVRLNVALGAPKATLTASRTCDDAVARWQADKSTAARELLSQAAKMGSSRCMVELGGIEMEDDDQSDAVQWFRKAAERGNVSGMLHLGGMYQLGIGVLEDPQRSVYWYRQAVDGGSPDAMYDLGQMYESGLGTPKDLNQAAALYRKAAQRGNIEAKARLARLTGESK
jgi:serine/threonine protein kinase